MLFYGTRDEPSALQLNSVENCLAYHLATLLEKVRIAENSAPLRAVILGCTQFPSNAWALGPRNSAKAKE